MAVAERPTLYTQQGARIHRLSNGFTILMERLPYLHSASIGLWIKAGSAHEATEECGLAHLLEHLFFKGTQKRNAHQLMADIERHGGQLNAFTSRGYTCLYVKCLEPFVNPSIEVLTDLAKNSLFNDLEKERNVILEEIATVEDTPDEYVHDISTERHWPNHPLGRPIAGYQYSVSALTREHVERFFNTWYQPGNMVFSIAGNFDEEAVLQQLREEFEPLPDHACPSIDSKPEFKSEIHVVDKDIAQAHVCLSFPGPPLSDMQRYACDLTASILGGGSTSRLFERIREDEGLVYSIYTYNSFYPSTGVLGIYAATAPQNYGKAVELTFEELRRLRDDALDEDELEMNRAQIKCNMLMSLESTFSRMSRLAKCWMYYGRLIPVDEVLANIDAVSIDDVQAFARQTFLPHHCAMVTLGPTGGFELTEAPL